MTDPAAKKRQTTAWVSGMAIGIVIGLMMFRDAVGVAFGISIGVAFAIAFGAFDRKKEGGRDGEPG
ncbi:hypothetical protein [Micromonospora sp. HUAS LYJ1]|uniref:hypothetical protein n=1 Tax=Micromonospora sp. HUAS LYJ1 TaxID=3061626 RepID=UPI0026738061|nr:hypothetical protein [Micromonospora sp. HUAS LYJ1]WKU04284.1 hypothetical protein Q2K16_26275 [Micromonospora sp. HUAS LYJ1]